MVDYNFGKNFEYLSKTVNQSTYRRHFQTQTENRAKKKKLERSRNICKKKFYLRNKIYICVSLNFLKPKK